MIEKQIREETILCVAGSDTEWREEIWKAEFPHFHGGKWKAIPLKPTVLWYCQRPQHSFVFLCKKAVLPTTRQQGRQRECAGGDEVKNPRFLRYLQQCQCDVPRATHVRRSQLRVNQPPHTSTAPNIAPSSRRRRIIPSD